MLMVIFNGRLDSKTQKTQLGSQDDTDKDSYLTGRRSPEMIETGKKWNKYGRDGEYMIARGLRRIKDGRLTCTKEWNA